MAHKFTTEDVRDLYRSYQAGQGSIELGESIGVHPGTIRQLFKRHGLLLRSYHEANLLRNVRMGPKRRKAATAAAHAAVRGRKVGLTELCRRAATKEQRGTARVSLYEGELARVLNQFTLTFQKACGPYNIDLAVGHSVAVEIFGGNWHASGRHAARHQKRMKYLLNHGWNVVVVWVNKLRGGPWMIAKKHIVALTQQPGRHQPITREYRVVWSDGQVYSTLYRNGDRIPLIRARHVGANFSTGRHERAG